MDKTKKNDLPAISQKTKRNDFIEIKYTGYANGQLFDSNIEEEAKKINPEAKVEKTIIVIGQGMVVPGLDKAVEDKELNKEYEIDVPFKDGFGERRRELLRTIPLSAFHKQKVDPQPGMVLALDNNIVKIITVSGARVMTDFNNPMAGKNLNYKFRIIRFVKEDKEKAETLFQLFFKFIPEFEVKESKVIVKGPQILEEIIKHYKEKFKELMKKDLGFEEKTEEKKEEKTEVKTEEKKEENQEQKTDEKSD